MNEEIKGVDPQIIADVRASFERATKQNPRFFQDFYGELLPKKKEYGEMFGDVNMVHQYHRLYSGILKLFEYAEEHKPATLHLVGSLHAKDYVNVKPAHYLDWVHALLEVLTKSDDKFDAKLAGKWVTVVKPGIEFMKSMY